MGKPGLLGSFSEVIYLCGEVGNLQPCLDVAHLLARAGDGSLSNQRAWENLLIENSKVLVEPSLHCLHIQIPGIEYAARGEIRHLPIRESDFCVESFFKALKNMNCSGRILCESPLMEDDAIYLRQIFENI